MNFPSNKNKFSIFQFNNISFWISTGISLWLFILLIGSALFLTFNVVVSTVSVWILNILFVAFYSLLLKREKFSFNHLLYFWLIFAGVIVSCGIFVSGFYDFSYDGQSYHGLAVYYLADGWNLFKNYLPYEGTNIFINHYTQGSWIVYTCFYKMINNFEFAKVINLLFMIIPFGILIKLFEEFKIKKWISIICAILIAFHPVGLNMFLGMYIDGQMASCITLLIVTLILLYLYPKNFMYRILLLGIFIYLINIKFTGLVFACYFFGCFGLLVILTKKFFLHIKNLLIGSIAIAVGIFFIGYSSYVKNVVYFNNPFYPLDISKSTKDVLSIEPSDFKQQNRVLNLLQATFAKTGYSNYYDKPIEYKFPFMIERKEVERYAFSGVMIGGMGVWFSGILIISIALLMMSWIADKHPQRKMYVAVLIISILFSCFLLEAPWWARYAPQLYLIPLICLLYYNLVFPQKLKIVYIMTGLLIINSLLIVIPYTYYNIIVTQKQKQQFSNMQTTHQKYAVDFRNSEAQRVHFEKYNIPYVEAQSNTFLEVPDTLFRSEVVYTPIQLVK